MNKFWQNCKRETPHPVANLDIKPEKLSNILAVSKQISARKRQNLLSNKIRANSRKLIKSCQPWIIKFYPKVENGFNFLSSLWMLLRQSEWRSAFCHATTKRKISRKRCHIQITHFFTTNEHFQLPKAKRWSHRINECSCSKCCCCWSTFVVSLNSGKYRAIIHPHLSEIQPDFLFISMDAFSQMRETLRLGSQLAQSKNLLFRLSLNVDNADTPLDESGFPNHKELQ